MCSRFRVCFLSFFLKVKNLEEELLVVAAGGRAAQFFLVAENVQFQRDLSDTEGLPFIFRRAVNDSIFKIAGFVDTAENGLKQVDSFKENDLNCCPIFDLPDY